MRDIDHHTEDTCNTVLMDLQTTLDSLQEDCYHAALDGDIKHARATAWRAEQIKCQIRRLRQGHSLTWKKQP